MDAFNRNPHFLCHKQLDGALEQWMIENKSEAYPNVEGSGAKSLKLMNPLFISRKGDELRDYGYVPGLRPDDPKELVQFYLKMRTRRKWHGERFQFTGERNWVIITLSRDGKGELSDWVSIDEFRQKLEGTMKFLEAQQRPGWSNAVAEHRAFLRGIVD